MNFCGKFLSRAIYSVCVSVFSSFLRPLFACFVNDSKQMPSGIYLQTSVGVLFEKQWIEMEKFW